MNPVLDYVIPAHMGAESLVSRELAKLDLQDIRTENGRVLCRGPISAIPRMNLRLRTGARVLIALGSFRARTFEELFQGALALPWEDYIPRDGKFPVKGYSLNSQLHAVPSCQAILKKALAQRLGKAYGLNTLPETGALYQVQFSLMKDTATLMIDTSGENLYKRGYRAQGAAAPLRETLAAVLITLTRYRGRDPLCDPFCGSGTIPIEAALIARNIAPGLNRTFSAQKWRQIPAQLWKDAAAEARDLEFHGTYDIWGGDIDPDCVALAQHNAKLAGVEDCIRFETADAAKFTRSDPKGRVITNPPYGERLLEVKEAEALCKAFGRATAKLPEGWSVGVLSGLTDFERAFGRPADKKRKLYNGMLRCDFFQYGV